MNKSCHKSEQHRRTKASSPALRLQISREYVGMESSGWVLSPVDDQSRRIISWSCRWFPRWNVSVNVHARNEEKKNRRISSHWIRATWRRAFKSFSLLPPAVRRV